MTCDEFCALVNEICDFIGFSMNSKLPLVSVSLVDTGMPCQCRPLLIVLIVIILVTSR